MPAIRLIPPRAKAPEWLQQAFSLLFASFLRAPRRPNGCSRLYACYSPRSSARQGARMAAAGFLPAIRLIPPRAKAPEWLQQAFCLLFASFFRAPRRSIGCCRLFACCNRSRN
ncbi:hypothetical protein [Paenibacillus glycanilyticus]|uniref:hypothetical protein n=1 Tax=Paenibacillus glycanilyticus TaxID=126569 RepID=UPI003EBC6304